MKIKNFSFLANHTKICTNENLPLYGISHCQAQMQCNNYNYHVVVAGSTKIENTCLKSPNLMPPAMYGISDVYTHSSNLIDDQ